MSALGQDRREEILQIATRLFYEHGFQSVGIRMIADEVGIQPSSLYYHFSSKEEILFQSWQARSDVINYCASVATSPDPDDPDLLHRQVEWDRFSAFGG